MTQISISDLLKTALEAQNLPVTPAPVNPAAPAPGAPMAPPSRALTMTELALEAHGILDAYEIYCAPPAAMFEERTIQDIVTRLARYGNISPKQITFVQSLLARIAERPQRDAARAAERASAADAPNGRRLEFEGAVISSKIVDSRFGSALKMLLQTADGWRVWGTVPAALGSVDRGDIVRLTATVEASKDDPKFGFYSRPVNARIIRRQDEAAA